MFPIPPSVRQCVKTLTDAGFEAYPVGGCVRDSLLGRTPDDWDITTSALPQQVQRLFPKTIPTGIAHGTITVLLENTPLEVTTFRGESTYSDGRHPDFVTFDVSLEADLARRDFTINAMALSGDGSLIDPFGGQKDLSNRLIRTVGDAKTRFTEDALRMFRAIRFAAQLGFRLDPKILSSIQELAPRAELLAKERIKVEVEKTLLSDHPDLAAQFFRLGLLSPDSPPAHPPSPPSSPPLPSGSSPAPVRGQPPVDPGFTPDLTPLLAVKPTPECRWRSFCRLSGFDITSLPTERKLKAAVLHPERALVKTLALQGFELMELGYRGEEIGRVQKALALHVLDHPEDNQKEKLLEILNLFPS